MELVDTQLLSPAKVNLMLRVLNRRNDGYHQLQTCFQLLNWGDEMTFKPIKEIGENKLEIKGFKNLSSEDNLIYKAAQMLKPWAQIHSDWLIEVKKNIPLGAGLGGGSSNAATALKFFNQAWQCDLSIFDLLALAAKLGADVPVFVLGQSAVATGIGEQLTPMSFKTPYIVLIFPDCHVNTTEIFKAPELMRNQSLLESDSLHRSSFWINDFMPVVIQRFPQINCIYQNLKNKMNLRLSGSGSTLFAVFDDLETAQLAQQLASNLCDSVIVQASA